MTDRIKDIALRIAAGVVMAGFLILFVALLTVLLKHAVPEAPAWARQLAVITIATLSGPQFFRGTDDR